MKQTLFVGLAVLVVATGLLASPVAATKNNTTSTTTNTTTNTHGGNTGGGPIINLGGITNAINGLQHILQSFTNNWDHTLKQVLIRVLFKPFYTILQQLVKAVSILLTHTPSVQHNSAVHQVYNQVLLVTYLLSGLAFAVTGLLYITGPLFGVTYNQVRMIIPRIIAALVFSTVALPLLQYTIEVSNALVQAFTPNQLSMTVTQFAGLSTAAVLAWVIESSVLLVVVLMFIIRDVYILFCAAISPLLALAWSFPRAKRYADSFIAGWWTALAMAPLDMLVLKFAYAMLRGNGGNIPGSISNWIIGVGAFTLLILVPYQLYGASQAAVGQAYTISKGLKNQARQAKSPSSRDFDLSQDEARRLQSYRRRKHDQSSHKRFRSDWRDE